MTEPQIITLRHFRRPSIVTAEETHDAIVSHISRIRANYAVKIEPDELRTVASVPPPEVQPLLDILDRVGDLYTNLRNPRASGRLGAACALLLAGWRPYMTAEQAHVRLAEWRRRLAHVSSVVETDHTPEHPATATATAPAQSPKPGDLHDWDNLVDGCLYYDTECEDSSPYLVQFNGVWFWARRGDGIIDDWYRVAEENDETPPDCEKADQALVIASGLKTAEDFAAALETHRKHCAGVGGAK